MARRAPRAGAFPGVPAAGLLLGASWVGVAVAVGVVVGRAGPPGRRLAALAVVALAAAVCVLVERRGGAVGRAVLRVAAGVTGVGVGVGISVPHVVRAGLAPMTVLGLLSLAAGLSLTVLGLRPLRTARWFVRAPAGAVVVVVAGLACLTLGQAVAATTVAPTRLGPGTPRSFAPDTEDVVVTASDGVALSAWYLPSANGAAVVLRHGAGSTRTATLGQAAALAESGFGVLMMDARGHGESAGVAMDFGWYGDLDVSAGVSYLTARPEVDPSRIGVVGLSMGGEEAIGAIAADPRIAAVVAEGATHRVPQDKSWLAQEYGLAGVLQERLDTITYGIAGLLTEARPPTPLGGAAALAAPRPILLVAAGAVPDEGIAARQIQSASPGSVDVWVAPDAAHIGALAADPAEWRLRVAGFLARTLAPQEG